MLKIYLIHCIPIIINLQSWDLYLFKIKRIDNHQKLHPTQDHHSIHILGFIQHSIYIKSPRYPILNLFFFFVFILLCLNVIINISLFLLIFSNSFRIRFTKFNSIWIIKFFLNKFCFIFVSIPNFHLSIISPTYRETLSSDLRIYTNCIEI